LAKPAFPQKSSKLAGLIQHLQKLTIGQTLKTLKTIKTIKTLKTSTSSKLARPLSASPKAYNWSIFIRFRNCYVAPLETLEPLTPSKPLKPQNAQNWPAFVSTSKSLQLVYIYGFETATWHPWKPLKLKTLKTLKTLKNSKSSKLARPLSAPRKAYNWPNLRSLKKAQNWPAFVSTSKSLQLVNQSIQSKKKYIYIYI